VTDVSFELTFLFLSILCSFSVFVYFIYFVIFCYHMFGEIKLYISLLYCRTVKCDFTRHWRCTVDKSQQCLSGVHLIRFTD